jgi:hypothetical protein
MSLLRIGNSQKSALKTAFRLFRIGSQSRMEVTEMMNDQARESRIQELSSLMKLAMAEKNWDEAYRLQAEWRAALRARSSAQIERMEQDRRNRHA